MDLTFYVAAVLASVAFVFLMGFGVAKRWGVGE